MTPKTKRFVCLCILTLIQAALAQLPQEVKGFRSSPPQAQNICTGDGSPGNGARFDLFLPTITANMISAFVNSPRHDVMTAENERRIKSLLLMKIKRTLQSKEGKPVYSLNVAKEGRYLPPLEVWYGDDLALLSVAYSNWYGLPAASYHEILDHLKHSLPEHEKPQWWSRRYARLSGQKRGRHHDVGGSDNCVDVAIRLTKLPSNSSSTADLFSTLSHHRFRHFRRIIVFASDTQASLEILDAIETNGYEVVLIMDKKLANDAYLTIEYMAALSTAGYVLYLDDEWLEVCLGNCSLGKLVQKSIEVLEKHHNGEESLPPLVQVLAISVNGGWTSAAEESEGNPLPYKIHEFGVVDLEHPYALLPCLLPAPGVYDMQSIRHIFSLRPEIASNSYSIALDALEFGYEAASFGTLHFGRRDLSSTPPTALAILANSAQTISKFYASMLDQEQTLQSTGDQVTTMEDIASFILGSRSNMNTKANAYCVNLILPSLSNGLRKDAELYVTELGGKILHGFSAEGNASFWAANKNAVADLYLERIPGDGSTEFPDELSTRAISWLMPNIEFIMPFHLKRQSCPRLFLAKSMHIMKALEFWLMNHQSQACLIYTGHSSPVSTPDSWANSVSSRDYSDMSRILHIAGKSWMKNTLPLIRIWSRHPEWPVLVLISNLQSIAEEIAELRNNIPGSLTNLQHLLYVDDEELSRLQLSINIHLCPSEIESFGHVANEARATAAVILAGNTPPLNEMLDPLSAVMVGRRSLPSSFNDFLLGRLVLNEDELEAGVQKILSLTITERAEMGRRARARYLEDHRYFQEIMRILRGVACQGKSFDLLSPHLTCIGL